MSRTSSWSSQRSGVIEQIRDDCRLPSFCAAFPDELCERSWRAKMTRVGESVSSPSQGPALSRKSLTVRIFTRRSVPRSNKSRSPVTRYSARPPTAHSRNLSSSGSRRTTVISNVVQGELERAPANLRQSILEGIGGLELELVAEDLESRRLFAAYEGARIVPPRYRNDLRHVASPRSPAWMRWYRGTSNI
jgi:hypothetical protein